MESSSCSLLGKEKDCEDFLRSLSEVRGVCDTQGGVFSSISNAPSSLVSLDELLIRFLDGPAFLLPSSESEDKCDRFVQRRFLADKLSGSSSSSSLEAPML